MTTTLLGILLVLILIPGSIPLFLLLCYGFVRSRNRDRAQAADELHALHRKMTGLDRRMRNLESLLSK